MRKLSKRFVSCYRDAFVVRSSAVGRIAHGPVTLRPANFADRDGAIAAIPPLWPRCPNIRLDWRICACGKFARSNASWLTQFASLLRMSAIALLLAIGLFALFPQWGYRLLSYVPVRQSPDRLGLTGEFGSARSLAYCGHLARGQFWAAFWFWQRLVIR
jgi:hypothetical protein